MCPGTLRALPPHFTGAHIFVLACPGLAFTATCLQFSPSPESPFPSAELHRLTLAHGLSLGPWAIPTPHVEGALAATIISGMIEPPAASLVDGDMDIFIPS